MATYFLFPLFFLALNDIWSNFSDFLEIYQNAITKDVLAKKDGTVEC